MINIRACMNKNILLVLLVGMCAQAWAQSTCETRVDAHQEASTNERVNYCLQPGYGDVNIPGPQLIYSAVDAYSIPQSPAVRGQRVTAPDKSFDYADIEVTHRFVQTRQFPKYTDGRVSEQYKRELSEALSSGPEIAQEAVSLTECEPQEDVLPPSVDETAKGLKARHTKPGRRWAGNAQIAASTPVEIPTDTVEEISSTAGGYTYEDDGYAPAVDNPGYEAYAPAGIAGEPAAAGATIDSAAYGAYAPAQTAAQDTEIAAGEYSYAPAAN